VAASPARGGCDESHLHHRSDVTAQTLDPAGPTTGFSHEAYLYTDPAQFLEAISGGPIDNAYAQMKGKMMIERSFEPAFKLGLAAKDAGLFLEAARRHDLDLPMLETIRERLEEAAREHGDHDMAATYLASAP